MIGREVRRVVGDLRPGLTDFSSPGWYLLAIFSPVPRSTIDIKDSKAV